MKSFCTASVILLIIAVFVTTLSLITYGAIDELCTLADSLPESVADREAEAAYLTAIELSQSWDKFRSLIEATASYQDIVRVDTEIRSLCAFAHFKNAADYCAVRSRLTEALNALKDSERLSLATVL